jgi:ABC-type nickel/cobalt efflux system permease component RcnA
VCVCVCARARSLNEASMVLILCPNHLWIGLKLSVCCMSLGLKLSVLHVTWCIWSTEHTDLNDAKQITKI